MFVVANPINFFLQPLHIHIKARHGARHNRDAFNAYGKEIVRLAVRKAISENGCGGVTVPIDIEGFSHGMRNRYDEVCVWIRGEPSACP